MMHALAYVTMHIVYMHNLSIAYKHKPCIPYHASRDEIVQAFSLLILRGSRVKLKNSGGEGEGLGMRLIETLK